MQKVLLNNNVEAVLKTLTDLGLASRHDDGYFFDVQGLPCMHQMASSRQSPCIERATMNKQGEFFAYLNCIGLVACPRLRGHEER